MEMGTTSQITLRVDDEIIESLKQDAIVKSTESGKQINYTDIIKQLLEDKYKEDYDNNPSVARQIFMVDEILPTKEINYYDIDNDITAMILAKDEQVMRTTMGSNRFMVPEFFICANPVWDIDKPLTMTEAKQKARESLNREEDRLMSKTLENAIEKDRLMSIDDENQIEDAIGELSEKIYDETEICVVSLLTSPYMKINFITENIKLNIIVSTMIPKKTMYLLPNPEFLGVIPERMKTKFFHCPEYKTMKDGIVAARKIGMAIFDTKIYGKIVLNKK